MCDYGCTDHQNQGIHIDPNDKHFRAEVDSFRCWGQTHDTDVRLWRWRERKKNKKKQYKFKNKSDKTEKVQRAISGVKWRLLELLSQNGHANSSTGIRGHVHNTTLPECKHWVGHPTHAECSHYNTCPDHTPNCFNAGADLSSTNIQLWLHSQVSDYTMESRLPCGSWGDSGRNSTAYVVYTGYINIFQRR